VLGNDRWMRAHDETLGMMGNIDRDQALQELDGRLHSRERVRLHERYQEVNIVLQAIPAKLSFR